MYSFKEYCDDQSKKYIDRWGNGARSFSKPWLGIAAPLDQYRFVMTRLDRYKKPYQVDMRGNPTSLKEYGTTKFISARQFWVDGQNAFFDGYSMILPSTPTPMCVNGDKYYVVVGIYDNCITLREDIVYFSDEFHADRITLGAPLMWFTPDLKGVCWAGLSPTPIIGGSTSSKTISCTDLIVPITTFVTPECHEDEDEPEYNFLKPLPANANQIITKWFSGEGIR